MSYPLRQNLTLFRADKPWLKFLVFKEIDYDNIEQYDWADLS